MNREIKFRAWCGKEMSYENDFYEIHCKPFSRIAQIAKFLDNHYDCDIMQYTGLKDKNNKDIYEGDIIRYWDIKKSLAPREVKWDRYASVSGWYTAGGHGISQDICGNPIMIIIGNIYENPELLE